MLMYMSYKDSYMYQIHEISQRLTNESEQILLERYGIGFSQFKVLLCLEERSGVPQKDIAHNLGQTEASISRQVTVLHGKGLIVIKSGKDSRQNLIYPTSRGVELITKSTNALLENNKTVFGNLNSKQQKIFGSVLEEINKYLTS